MIRVLIVAPYASARAGLHAMLADQEACLPIGAISGSAELERLLSDARPDVVILDDHAGDGQRVVELLSGGEVGLVMLGDARGSVPALAGASLPGWAYLLKEADAVEIAAAVRAVAAGLIVIDPSYVASLRRWALGAGRWVGGAASPRVDLSRSDTASPEPSAQRPELPFLPDEALTAREREVLQLMADGLQNRQIAARLHISPHTAKFHVASILAKLGAASRTEAVTLAARRGDLVL